MTENKPIDVSAQVQPQEPTTQAVAGHWRVGKDHRIETPTPGGGCVVIVSEHAIGDYRHRRLISATPELLEACKALVLAEGAMIGTEYGNELLEQAINLAKLAITKTGTKT